MKRILVTGGAGFIGSAFVRYQLRRYPDVHIVVLDKLTYAGNLDNLKEAASDRFTFIRGDVANREDAANAMNGCDAIAHFAAESHVDRSLAGAADFISTNVAGVNVILEEALARGIKRILLVSTDEVYGSIESGAFAEDAPLRPRNPYAASKAAGELFGLAFHASHGSPVLITRGSNTYGPYQYPEKALPLFITNAIDGQPLPIYGDGRNVRDWLFVDDHCSGIDLVLRNGEPGQIYNIADGNEKQNNEVARRLLELMNASPSLIRFVRDRAGHDRRYAIDSSKIRALGWTPATGWEDGMAATVRWYKENEWWWRKIKRGDFREYYDRLYGPLLSE
ncbi:MAG TPA: dTDP-glucose 4,6-dehydratase [Candidatus Hydrogenedentes bacterium]|nr:dTDP-glucose 4,6-dehydratase [Candidatus Hydrogenedentota bacterium]